MIPCCGSSFCDDCVRTALVESEDNECPDCNEKGSSPESLIPNRFLRNSVNAFRNETGYNKPRPQRAPPKIKEQPKVEQPELKEELQEAEVEKEIVEPEEKLVEDDGVVVAEEKEITEKCNENVEEEKSTRIEKTPPPGVEDKDNESDYEDNITVTVPPAHTTSHGAFRERNYIPPRHRHPKPPGLDTPPKHHSHVSSSENF